MALVVKESPALNSHDMLHKLVQQIDLWLNGEISIDALVQCVCHAEQILDIEDRQMIVKHDHSILMPVEFVDAEFEVIAQC